LEPQDKLGQYTLIRKIGEGGMAEVWEARHDQLGSRAAIKFLLPEFTRNKDLQERFLNEGKRQALTTENLHKVDAWTARHRLAIAEWPIDPYDPFFNINRPQDLIEAERILSEPSPRCPR